MHPTRYRHRAQTEGTNDQCQDHAHRQRPYLVEGPVRVVDADGAAYDITEQRTIFLCRCGNSRTKPFCDGTHETLHFNATHRAAH